MTPERIFRSARTAHGLVPYSLPPPATLLPSRRSAVCIIAMSVEPREMGEAARSLVPALNRAKLNFEQGHRRSGQDQSARRRQSREAAQGW